jgi:MFS family permease
MQNVLGYSPTQAGAAFLPMTILIVLLAPMAGRLSDRIGSRWLMGAGLVFVSISLVIESTFTVSSSYWNILPAMLVGGMGMAFAMTPTAAAAMGSVAVDKAGVGSAVLNSMRQVGGSLGIALMGAIVAASAHVSTTDPRAPEQFINGFRNAVLVAAAIALAGAVVAVLTVRRVQHEPEQQPILEAA